MVPAALLGAGGEAAAVAIELASEKKVFSLPAKCRSRRRKLNKSLTNTEGFQRLARCIFMATQNLTCQMFKIEHLRMFLLWLAIVQTKSLKV